MWPRWTVTPVGGTSAILMVLFSLATIASARSWPTFLASTSNAATNSTSRTWYVAELHVHEPGDAALRVGVLVVLDALDQRRGAVADADDGHSYRTHGCSFSVFSRRAGAAGCVGPDRSVVRRVRARARRTGGGAARRRSARRASGPRARRTRARAAAARGCSCRPAPGCATGRPGSRPCAPRGATGAPRGCAAGWRVGAAEEREVHAEALVVPGRGAALVEQLREVLLALRRELVDDPRPLAGRSPGGLAPPR